MSRNMLNINQKKGSLSLHLSIDDEHYIIKRNLKKGKSKDSVQSQLRKIDEPTQTEETDILIHQKYDARRSSFGLMDEIAFTNDTELQKTVDSLLPPKEVLMHTQFLLQDSDNIFAMQAAQRITVFKNIFGLLSIDDAKDVVAQKRREIQTTIKVLGDTSNTDRKLQNNMTMIARTYRELEESEHSSYSRRETNVTPRLANCHALFSPLEENLHQLSIINFSPGELGIEEGKKIL